MQEFDGILYEKAMRLLEKYFNETLSQAERMELFELNCKYPDQLMELLDITGEKAPETFKRKEQEEIAHGLKRVRKSMRQQKRKFLWQYLRELFTRQPPRSFLLKLWALFVKQRREAIFNPPYQKKTRRPNPRDNMKSNP